MRLPCDILAGKFTRIWEAGDGNNRIVVGLLHPFNPFGLKQDELAYIKAFYMATDYTCELTADLPITKNRSMYGGFIILTKGALNP